MLATEQEKSTAQFEVIQLTPRQAHQLWDHLSPWVESALSYAHGELNMYSAKVHTCSGLFQMWAIYDKESKKAIGALLTCRQNYDHVSALRVVTIGGDRMPEWAHLVDSALVKFAKSLGLSRLEASGRKGLAKRLNPIGFETAYTTFIKEI